MSLYNSDLKVENVKELLKDRGTKIYFVGVGGISMSALCEYCFRMGYDVAGSDRCENENTHRLSQLGIQIHTPHTRAAVRGYGMLVYSLAVDERAPEITDAKEQDIPLVSRSMLLGAIIGDYKYRVGVSGTHGKSTVTAMLADIFSVAGMNPTVFVGANMSDGNNLRIGDKETVLYESCEYRDSFLNLAATHQIVTSLELDHTDYFADYSQLLSSFTKCCESASFRVINTDYELSRRLASFFPDAITYGSGEKCDYRYVCSQVLSTGISFSIYRPDGFLGNMRIRLLGEHNMANAVAAVAMAMSLGVDFESCRYALENFRGIGRRMELIGKINQRSIVYDYAHHPTEVASSLKSLKKIYGEITVLFAPHTFSRTQSLWSDFVRALSIADHVCLLDIYPARERAIEGVSSERLAEQIGRRAVKLDKDCAVEYVLRNTRGAIAIMGAGDLEQIKLSFIKLINK